MTNIITEAEDKLGLNSTQCPAFLGYDKGLWSRWKNGVSTVPVYVHRSISAHLLLPVKIIKRLRKERI